MHDNPQIYIEFFDIRAAEAAFGGMNGLEVAGKQLKLALTYPESQRWVTGFFSFSPWFIERIQNPKSK